ncbi:MAG: hypothetical protein GYA21_17605 [Myxococcales bacterium]|nr:hypothetical protein [Myxococcales bacterium]
MNMTLLDSLRRWFSTDPENPDSSKPERESPRFNATIVARYNKEGPLAERRGNVGIGGFCFEGEREIVAGTEVALEVRLPGLARRIRARGLVLGQVRYPGWLGIRGKFIDISLDDERELARWIDRTSKEINRFQSTSINTLAVSY